MKRVFLVFLLVVFVSSLRAQKMVNVSGYVLDSLSKEPLIGVVILDVERNSFLGQTNEFGFFSFKIRGGERRLKFYYLGFEPKEMRLSLFSDTVLIVYMSGATQLPEVVVSETKYRMQSPMVGNFRLPTKVVEQLPSYFGENDPLKMLQLFPGIVGGTDWTNALSVRGGSPDQNLVLLDGVPLYNPNHALGIFSVFNNDAIKYIEVYKGGFPARYGGRLSSVIDIRTKDGNLTEFNGAVELGMLATKFYLEGPIVRDKVSWMVSYRRSFWDIIFKPIINYLNDKELLQVGLTPRSGVEKIYPNYFFQDLFIKLNWLPSQKTKIFTSVYFGGDLFSFKYLKKVEESSVNYLFTENYDDYFRSKWGNKLFTLNLNHQLFKDFFVNLIFTYSGYDFITDLNIDYNYDYWVYDENAHYQYDELMFSKYISSLYEVSSRLNVYYQPSKNHYIKAGYKFQYHYFYPAEIHWNIDFRYNTYIFQTDTVVGANKLWANEQVAYIEDIWRPVNWLTLRLGLRNANFVLEDTTFKNFLPRISFSLNFSKWSIKAAYDKTVQFLHYLTNDISGVPTDVWLPSTKRTLPEIANLFSTGVYYSINNWTFSIEAFYKQMENLISLNEGENIFTIPKTQGIGEIWEQKIAQGKGWAYGLELSVKKDVGNLTGWLSFTYSRSFRQFPTISQGKIYPYRFDKPIVFNITLNYKFNSNKNMSLIWYYASGMPITLFDGEFMPYENLGTRSYYYSGQSIYYIYGYPYFSHRNNWRLPAYHRLDVNFNFVKVKPKYTRIWTVGIYNVYNRLNASHVFVNRHFEVEDGLLVRKTTVRIYSYMPFMPMLSYRLKW